MKIFVTMPDRLTDRQTSKKGIVFPVNIENVLAMYWSNCLSIQNLRPEVTLATLLYKAYMNINTGQTDRQTYRQTPTKGTTTPVIIKDVFAIY